jgi:hypothetical protein
MPETDLPELVETFLAENLPCQEPVHEGTRGLAPLAILLIKALK